MKNVLYLIGRYLFAMLVCFYVFQLTSCIKSITLISDDYEYIYTEKDYYYNSTNYQIIPLKNGNNYFYTKTKNNFGWYYLYSSTCKDEHNVELKLKTTVNVFYDKIDIAKLYNSNVLLSSNNVIKNEKLLNIYQFEKGNFIQIGNYKYISIIANNILYSIELEGDCDITEDELLEIIHKKIAIINSKNLLNK